MVQACCCMSLEKGVKIVAVISLMWTCALIAEEILLVAVYGCQGLQKIQEQNPEFGEIVGDEEALLNVPINSSAIELKHKEVKLAVETAKKLNQDGLANLQKETSLCSMTKAEIAVSCVWVASWVFDLLLAILLIYGANTKSIKLLLAWFYIRCAILSFRVIFLIIYCITGLPIVAKIPVIILFIFRIYSLWIVNSYTNELITEREAKSKVRVSTVASRVDLEAEKGIDNPMRGLTPLW